MASHGAVRQGLVETSFSGAYSELDAGDSDIDLLLVDVKAGYFVTNALQISGAVSYFDMDIDGDGLDALMLGAGADYHFLTQTEIVPYVGAGINWVDVNFDGIGDDDDYAWEARAGMKQFVAQNVAIKYQVSYIDFDDLDLSGITVNVGLSFFF